MRSSRGAVVCRSPSAARPSDSRTAPRRASPTTRARPFAVAFALLAAFASLATMLAPGAARADDAIVGPPLGNNRYLAAISEPGDVDDYPARFVPGDVLSVTVSARKASKLSPPTLRPVLVLVDPDGLVRFSGVVKASNGFSTALRSFRIDKAGLWAARVYGRDDTAGAYGIAFQVRPVGRTVLRHQLLGNELPFARDHVIRACDGATLDATLSWTRQSEPVEIRALLDPTGAAVADAGGGPVVERAVSRGRRTTLAGVVMRRGDGAYVLRTRIPTAVATYDLTLDLRSPARPSSRRTNVLAAEEPALDAAPVPFPGEPGDLVTFTGSGFSTTSAPSVRFGDTAATDVSVSADGRTLSVRVPPRAEDAVVAISVVNPDGQAVRRPRYFAYLPPPEVFDLLDAATGAPVRQATAGGGFEVRLVGKNFEDGYEVRVGATLVPAPTLVSTQEYRFALPVVPQGTYTVQVVDPYARTGTTPFTVFLKTPPAFAAAPYSPGALRIQVATTVTISGTNFEAADRLVFDGQDVPSTFVGPTARRFDVPPLAAGSYTVTLVDSIGTVVAGEDLFVKAPPTITAVSVSAGDVIGTTTIPVSGGSTIQVDGTDLLPGDAVHLGGAAVGALVSSSPTRKRFLAPAHAPGLVSITITDGAGQSASATDVLRYAGFVDDSGTRAPSASSVDDFSAARGATGDLDRDGREDDLVIVSPLGDAPGSRTAQTRVLRGDASGVLRDVTSTAMPAAQSDSFGQDVWAARCVALGDLDRQNGLDLLIGGEVVSGGGNTPQVRTFLNDGSGAFALDESLTLPSRYVPYVLGGYYYAGYVYYYSIYGPSQQEGVPRAVAIGDVDLDGDADVVTGADHFQSRQVYLNPAYVNFATYPATIYGIVPVQYLQYLPALRVFDNRVGAGEGFVDVSGDRLPVVGSNASAVVTAPAFHCRDLALRDIDRDQRRLPDLVISWNDPRTVSPHGLRTADATGTSQDSPRTATRILQNVGGRFTTDVTSTWLPAASAPEFWQADRVAVEDLNGDGWPELILLSSRGLDAYTGTETHGRSALRVLRNDQTRFTDVTSLAIPAPVAATGDDWRGDALAIRDVDGDTFKDIVVSTHDDLRNGSARVPRMRLFLGGSNLRFKVSSAFQPAATADTGEADDLLFLGDLAGPGRPVLVLIGEAAPAVSPSATPFLRTQEWKK